MHGDAPSPCMATLRRASGSARAASAPPALAPKFSRNREKKVKCKSKSGLGLLAIAAIAQGLVVAVPASGKGAAPDRRMSTFANPIDLPYRYQPIKDPKATTSVFREAADPTVVFFKGRYWLFASHSHGYWWSTNLLDWTFVEQKGAGVERYAPTAVVIGERLYMATSDLSSKIWVTDDPMTREWGAAADIPPHYWDPALFLDDDGRLYMYYGLSEKNPLLVEELDPRTFKSLTPKTPIPASRRRDPQLCRVIRSQHGGNCPQQNPYVAHRRPPTLRIRSIPTHPTTA